MEVEISFPPEHCLSWEACWSNIVVQCVLDPVLKKEVLLS